MTAAAVEAGGEVDDVLFAARCAGDDVGVGGMLADLQATLAVKLVDPDRTGDMMIVLGEMLNNTVEHAMRDQDGGWIDLSVRDAGARIEVVTRDDGRALPPALLTGDVELPEAGEDVETMPEGGFGWFLIHSLVDDLTYERDDGVNRISFSF